VRRGQRGPGQTVVDWLPAVVVMGLIFWTSSQSVLPGPADKGSDFLFKKFAHLMAYSALALGYLRGVHGARRPYLLAFVLTVLWAVSDEFHQSTVPLREPTLRDVLIDTTGGGVVLWLARRATASAEGILGKLVRTATGIGTGAES
jgi:VanZ family protein